MVEFVKVVRTTDFEPGQARLVEVKGKRIALFKVGGEYCAIDNTCTHRGGPLVQGKISGYEVTCPFHGSKFDIRTGEVLGPPASQSVACYGVRVEGGDLVLEV